MQTFLAELPEPPYFAAVFSAVRTSLAVEDYAQIAAQMTELAAQQPGYLGVESVRDVHGQGITVSYWSSLEAIAHWKAHADHCLAQQAGRDRYYQNYRLRIGMIDRDVAFDREMLPSTTVERMSGLRSFSDLAESRKTWIHQTLRNWCQQANRNDLLLAEQEWTDIAGKADPVKTLWAWAWNRFPQLVHDDLGIDESAEVEVTVRAGTSYRGYPDARNSAHGQLVLYLQDATGKWQESAPLSIDDVQAVQRIKPQS